MRHVALCAALLLAAPVPSLAEEPAPDAPKERACMFARSVDGFEVQDRKTIVLTAGTRQRMVATLGAGCLNADHPFEMAVISQGVCIAVGDRISYRDPGLGQQSCMIVKLEAESGKPADDAPPAGDTPG